MGKVVSKCSFSSNPPDQFSQGPPSITNTEQKILDQAALSLGLTEEMVRKRNAIPARHRSVLLPTKKSWGSYEELPPHPKDL